jgi:hypothetical protein
MDSDEEDEAQDDDQDDDNAGYSLENEQGA